MSELTLYTSPRACSTACHVALEESGLPFEAKIVRVRDGEHTREAYLRVNPWGKVPALGFDGGVLTEAHAILSYVADVSAVELLPSDPLPRARAHEWMNFLSSTVHMAFRPLWRPYHYLDDEELYPRLFDVGASRLRQILLEVERRLTGKTWALGDRYSVCDAYLFIFHVWSQRDDVRAHVAEMPHWMAHRERMEERPATWAALEREGITRENIRLP